MALCGQEWKESQCLLGSTLGGHDRTDDAELHLCGVPWRAGFVARAGVSQSLLLLNVTVRVQYRVCCVASVEKRLLTDRAGGVAFLRDCRWRSCITELPWRGGSIQFAQAELDLWLEARSELFGLKA